MQRRPGLVFKWYAVKMWEGLGCCLHPELIHQLPLQSGQCIEDLAWSLSGTRSKCGRGLGCCLHPEQIHQLPLLSGQCIEDLAWSLSGTRSKCGRGLAPDSGVSATSSVTDPPPSGASPLPPLITGTSSV